MFLNQNLYYWPDMQEMNIEQKIKSVIRDVPDFPKPGIIFKDITPVLKKASLRAEIVKNIGQFFSTQHIDAVAGIEARGFIFGTSIADYLQVPFLPVRKAGKLPYKTITESYDLEYGTSSIEMHEDAFVPGWNVLIHDDLLATGGTAAACGRLIERAGAKVAGFSFLIELGFLEGAVTLEKQFGVEPHILVHY